MSYKKKWTVEKAYVKLYKTLQTVVEIGNFEIPDRVNTSISLLSQLVKEKQARFSN